MSALIAALPAASAVDDVAAVAADVLVVVGVVVIAIGVLGIFRMPDPYTQLHATSKAVFLGVIALLVASLATRDGQIAAKVVLIGVFLILTTPVGAHVIARGAYRQREPMRTPGARDESGRLEQVPEGKPASAEDPPEV